MSDPGWTAFKQLVLKDPQLQEEIWRLTGDEFVPGVCARAASLDIPLEPAQVSNALRLERILWLQRAI